jgi:hypothetical protein
MVKFTVPWGGGLLVKKYREGELTRGDAVANGLSTTGQYKGEHPSLNVTLACQSEKASVANSSTAQCPINNRTWAVGPKCKCPVSKVEMSGFPAQCRDAWTPHVEHEGTGSPAADDADRRASIDAPAGRRPLEAERAPGAAALSGIRPGRGRRAWVAHGTVCPPSPRFPFSGGEVPPSRAPAEGQFPHRHGPSWLRHRQGGCGSHVGVARLRAGRITSRSPLLAKTSLLPGV